MKVNASTIAKAAIIASFISVFGAAAKPAHSQSQQPEKLTVRFTWRLATYYTPLFVALNRGYYSKEGLDVNLAEGSGAETVVQLVANGNDKVAYGPGTVAAEAASRDLPVIVVAIYMPKIPIGLISFPDVPLKTPKDLEGRKLGVSVGETFSNMLAPFARINNIDVAKINTVQLETSARNSQFMTRKIDVMSLYINDQVPLLEKRTGVRFNVMRLSDVGLGLLGQGFIVNRDFTKSNPETIRKLLRATAKGYADTFKDPAAAVEIMRKYMTVKIDTDVMMAQLKETLDATVVPKGHPIGWQYRSLWQNNLDLLRQTNRINAIKDIGNYYTNEFL